MPLRVAQAAFVAGGLILVAIGWMVATTILAPPAPAPASTVLIPPVGQAVPVRLADGRPAFVVHHQTGGISVLDAFSTHVTSGVFKMVAWCPEARIFEDLAHGARYDEWGARTGGPAPTDMIAMSWQVGSGGFISVGAPLGPIRPRKAIQPPAFDQAGCTWTLHDFGGDRRLTPAQAAAQPEGAWVVVAGKIDPLPHRLCALAAGCVDPALVDGLVVDPSAAGNLDFLTDPRQRRWLARVIDGRLAHLTMIPVLDAT